MAATRSVYRSLLRACKELFNEDIVAWRKAKLEVRLNFEKNRHVVDDREIGSLIKDAKEAEDFLSANIVQARKTSRGSYAVSLKNPDAPQSTAKSHINFEPMTPQDALKKSNKG